MRNFVFLAITVLAMTLLLSGMVSAAESTKATDQATATTDAKEQVNQSPLARRNAAARALKAEIDKQNAERNSNAQQQEVQQEVQQEAPR